VIGDKRWRLESLRYKRTNERYNHGLTSLLIEVSMNLKSRMISGASAKSAIRT
jgi:hypothetical protein